MACGHSCTLRRNPLQTPVHPSSGPSPCHASPYQPPRGVTGTGGPIRESAEETQWLRGKSPNPHCHGYKELRLLNFSWQLIPSAFWALWYLCCSRFLPLICLFLKAAVSLSVKWGSCWDQMRQLTPTRHSAWWGESKCSTNSTSPVQASSGCVPCTSDIGGPGPVPSPDWQARSPTPQKIQAPFSGGLLLSFTCRRVALTINLLNSGREESVS